MKSNKLAVQAKTGKLVPFQAMTPDQIITAQRARYDEILTTDSAVYCEAGQDTTFQIMVSELGVFHCQSITGSYTTLSKFDPVTGTNIALPYDDGVNTLSIQIKDGANALPLTNGFVDLALLLSCGRVKSATAKNNTGTYTFGATTFAQASASGFLFYPMKFDYYFPKLSAIQFVVRNTGTAGQTLQLAFHGERVRGVANV